MFQKPQCKMTLILLADLRSLNGGACTSFISVHKGEKHMKIFPLKKESTWECVGG